MSCSNQAAQRIRIGAHPLNSAPSPQLHRRLLYDDDRGVDEPLDESSDIFPEGLVVRGRLLLSLDRPPSAADTHRPLAEEVVLQPLLTFTDGDLDANAELEASDEERSAPGFPLPHIYVSLEAAELWFLSEWVVLWAAGCAAPCGPPPHTHPVG